MCVMLWMPNCRRATLILEMKILIAILAMIMGATGGAFFVPLYWLPETREIVRKNMPNHGNWVGFEAGLWMEIVEEDKLLLLDEIGVLFDQMEGEWLNATWKRIGDWGTFRT